MSRKPIQAPSSSSSPPKASAECSLATFELLFPEAMSVNTLAEHLTKIGLPTSQLVSLTHSDLRRLYRLHVMPKPRRTLTSADSSLSRSWMEEMELGVDDSSDDEKEKPKSAFAGMKRRQDSSGYSSSPPRKYFRPDHGGGGGGDRLKPPPSLANKSSKVISTTTKTASSGDSNADNRNNSKRPRITFP